MLRRIGLRRTFLLAALVAGSAACGDDSPTLAGDPFFPGGTRPTTREVIIPAGAAFRPLGVFTNYSGPANAPYSVVANRFGGELSANALYRTSRGFPAELRYTQDNVNRTDTVYRAVGGSLVVRLDSASSSAGPVTLQAYRIAQNWHAPTATWENASDTSGVRTPWATPGGTRGALLSQRVYTAQAGDSLVLPLDSAAVAALRDSTGFGLMLSVAETGARLQIDQGSQPPVLRVSLRPASALRDTLISTDISLGSQPNTFVFTPEPPQPVGALAAGGIRSARSLFSLVFPDSLDACPAGTTPCGRVALRDVSLNRVSLILRRLPVSPAFSPLDSTILSVFSITEPELGRRAPLGEPVLDPDARVVALVRNLVTPQQAAVFAPGDTTVELDFTNFATVASRGDTVPTTFALLGGPSVGISSIRQFQTFGLAAFAPEPRLRIVYTPRARAELP
ncbi:MAG TPA: hypothetical protein VF613_12480 [Longimicrobium sp.]|jgi:hypothetical protein